MKLIVKYCFNETEGDLYKDSSGNDLHIDITDGNGKFEYSRPKPVPNARENHPALEFTGKELLKRENHSDLNPDQITVMAWVFYRDPFKNSGRDQFYKGSTEEWRLALQRNLI